MADRIVLLGPPASGKGTQGRRLAEDCTLAYFSTGRQLRSELKRGSDLGRQAAPYLARGQYVPDELALALALGWLRSIEGGWVLDGFPRTLPQARELDRFLHPEEAGLRALELEVAPAELARRITERCECRSCSWTGTRSEAKEADGRCPSCGGELGAREDDELENFRQRHRAYDRLTGPVADYYDQSHRLRRVSGAGSPEEVFGRIQAALKPR